MENIYHEAIFQDVIRLSNKLSELMNWVKDQELIAVNEERYLDACKWRDFPQHDIVRENNSY